MSCAAGHLTNIAEVIRFCSRRVITGVSFSYKVMELNFKLISIKVVQNFERHHGQAEKEYDWPCSIF